ncbi:MAG TPA: hypothetical protein PKD78_02035 [Saprospiraceae bacterium]|nr:hypothetical protein [Saprospiraceae bacterium]
MKQLLAFALLLFAAATCFAQVPQSFNYQAVARDAGGQPISGGQVSVTARILRNGTEVYAEKTDHTTTATGLFTLRVGEADPTDFQAIDWSLGGYALQVSVDGAIVIQTAAAPIVSVPYALLAHRVAEEQQQLVLNGNQLSITGAGGNTVTLTSGGTSLQAGSGIEISNNTIINRGDLNPGDDVLKTDQAGGDVGGTFDNLQIKAASVGTSELADNAVNAAKIADNTVGTTELASGSITAAKLNSMGAANGQVLKWNSTSGTWIPENDNTSAGSGTAATSAPITGDGSAAQPIALTPGTAAGQVLKWNGTSWTSATDEVGSGGDNWGTQTVKIGGGALSGNGTTASPLTLSPQGAADGQVLKWDAGSQQWKPGNDVTVGGNAGGDVNGTYSNLSVIRIQGKPVDATIPQAGQVLKWNGSAWKPLPDDTNGGGSSNSYLAGTGISITGTGSPYTINNEGVLKTTDATKDLSGNFNSGFTVERLKGNPISNTAPTNGQVLKWNGASSAWEPQTDQTGGSGGNNYSAGTGISFSGTPPNITINNSGDTDANNDLTTATTFGGANSDVNGLYTNLQITANSVTSSEIANSAVGNTELADGAVTSSKISQMSATTGQVLKWTASGWQPQNESGGTSQWTTDASGIFYPNTSNGTVRVNRNGTSNKLVEMGPANKTVPSQVSGLYSPNAGGLTVYGENGNSNVLLGHVINTNNTPLPNNGAIAVQGTEGYRNTPPGLLYAAPDNSGGFYLSNPQGKEIVVAGSDDTDQVGFFSVLNSNLKPNISLTSVWSYPGNGALSVYGTDGVRPYAPAMLYANASNGGGLYLSNSTGKLVLDMGDDMDDTGYLLIKNASEKLNVSMGHYSGYSGNGYVGVFGPSGVPKAGIYVDEAGKGIVFKDMNQFRMVHPADSTLEIRYVSIEGPEAAAYERGTAQLKNGEAFVPYSSHFSEVINFTTMTVTLTPLSTDTDGLAVVEKMPTGFKVRELRGGTGHFSFDWEVKGVRKGYEDFVPVHPRKAVLGSRDKHPASSLTPRAAEPRVKNGVRISAPPSKQ